MVYYVTHISLHDNKSTQKQKANRRKILKVTMKLQTTMESNVNYESIKYWKQKIKSILLSGNKDNFN